MTGESRLRAKRDCAKRRGLEPAGTAAGAWGASLRPPVRRRSAREGEGEFKTSAAAVRCGCGDWGPVLCAVLCPLQGLRTPDGPSRD